MFRVGGNAVAKIADPRKCAQQDQLDLKCQICLNDMLPPSTEHTRFFTVFVCRKHIIHTQCRAHLKNDRHDKCPMCGTTRAVTACVSEETSNAYWDMNVRPECGCGRRHMREAAACCPRRLTMCLFPGCFDIYPWDETEDHYAAAHPGQVVATEPTCPFAKDGCREPQTLETMASHILTCEHRPATCICGQTGTVYAVRTHQQECKKIRCPASSVIKHHYGYSIGRCTHGLYEQCPMASLMRAIADSPVERTDDIIKEIAAARKLSCV